MTRVLTFIFILSFAFHGKGQCPLIESKIQQLKPEGKANLLLLGVRDSDNAYHTYVIKHEPGNTSLKAKLPYLVTPQESGFYYGKESNHRYWNIWADTFYDGSGNEPQADTVIISKREEELVFSRSLSALWDTLQNEGPRGKTEKPDISTKKHSNHRSIRRLVYIVPDIMSLSSRSGGYYYGAAHPIGSNSIFSIPFPSSKYFRIGSHKDHPKNLLDTLPKCQFSDFLEGRVGKIKKAFYKVNHDLTYKAYIRPFPVSKIKPFPLEKVDRREFSLPDSVDKNEINKIYQSYYDKSFYLKHCLGKVHLFMVASESVPHSVTVTRSLSHVVDVGPVSEDIRPNNSLPFQLDYDTKELLRKQNDDFFVSPSEDVVFYYNHGKDYSGIFKSCQNEDFKIEFDGEIVMAEWAVGQYVEAWEDELFK